MAVSRKLPVADLNFFWAVTAPSQLRFQRFLRSKSLQGAPMVRARTSMKVFWNGVKLNHVLLQERIKIKSPAPNQKWEGL